MTSTRPIGSADPAKQVPLPGSSGTSLASQAAAKSPPPPTPGALIGAGGPPSFPFNPAQAYQQAQDRQASQQEAMDVATPQGAGESNLQSPISLGSHQTPSGQLPPVPAPSQSDWIRLIGRSEAMGGAIQHFGWNMPSHITPDLVAYATGALHRAFIQAKGKLNLVVEHQLFLTQTDMSTPQLAAAANRDPQAAVGTLRALATSLASAFLSLHQAMQQLGEGARKSDPAASLCAALAAAEIGGNEVFGAPAAPTTHLVGQLSR